LEVAFTVLLLQLLLQGLLARARVAGAGAREKGKEKEKSNNGRRIFSLH